VFKRVTADRFNAALLGLLLSATACTTASQGPRDVTNSSDTPASTTTHTSPTTAPTSTKGVTTTMPRVYVTVTQFSIEVRLPLDHGQVSASFEFDAPNPVTHFFDVLVVMPIGTELEVFFETANGGTLRILDQSRYDQSCLDEATEMRCLLHFPTLEAQGAGVWSALVNKLSDPAAEISISVVWMTEG